MSQILCPICIVFFNKLRAAAEPLRYRRKLLVTKLTFDMLHLLNIVSSDTYEGDTIGPMIML